MNNRLSIAGATPSQPTESDTFKSAATEGKGPKESRWLTGCKCWHKEPLLESERNAFSPEMRDAGKEGPGYEGLN